MKVIFPNKVDEPMFLSNYRRIRYFTGPKSSKTVDIKLPSWVAGLIRELVENGERRGRERLQEEIAEVLGYELD